LVRRASGGRQWGKGKRVEKTLRHMVQTINYNDSTGYTTDADLSAVSGQLAGVMRFLFTVNNNGDWAYDSRLEPDDHLCKCTNVDIELSDTNLTLTFCD